MKCFTGSVQNADGRLVGYGRRPRGWVRLRPLFKTGERSCFEASRVEKVALAAPGMEPAVFDTHSEVLGKLELKAVGVRYARSIAVEADDDGVLRLRSRLGPLDFASVGLRSGDELVAIDAAPMTGLAPDEAEARLNRFGDPPRLTVRGADGLREVALRVP